ncbi:hypothetical protein, partial [Nocardia cyriacigeorgica]|uniref:hypothetical protein n=1 Tax=Nocardia cyriacigeorgica TaxID=135487 RepID=UPI003CC806D5
MSAAAGGGGGGGARGGGGGGGAGGGGGGGGGGVGGGGEVVGGVPGAGIRARPPGDRPVVVRPAPAYPAARLTRVAAGAADSR